MYVHTSAATYRQRCARVAVVFLAGLFLAQCGPAQPSMQNSPAQQPTALAQPTTSTQTSVLANIRQTVPYPVFIPSYTPAGLVPDTPMLGDQNTPGVRIRYHAPDGNEALLVLSGPAGCCLDSDPRKTGMSVTLPNDVAAHFIALEPRDGGSILWWTNEGAYVSLSGSQLTKDELIQIAASMSKTTDLQ